MLMMCGLIVENKYVDIGHPTPPYIVLGQGLHQVTLIIFGCFLVCYKECESDPTESLTD